MLVWNYSRWNYSQIPIWGTVTVQATFEYGAGCALGVTPVDSRHFWARTTGVSQLAVYPRDAIQPPQGFDMHHTITPEQKVSYPANCGFHSQQNRTRGYPLRLSFAHLLFLTSRILYWSTAQEATASPCRSRRREKQPNKNSRLFETPVRRIGVSGGTAPFFPLSQQKR